jgi:hypothetical protein
MAAVGTTPPFTRRKPAKRQLDPAGSAGNGGAAAAGSNGRSSGGGSGGGNGGGKFNNNECNLIIDSDEDDADAQVRMHEWE